LVEEIHPSEQLTMARSVSVPFEEVLKQLEEEFDAVEREYQGIDEI
jgi:hypothetical protein